MKPRKRPRKPIQLTLDSARRPTGHGGWRPGAGRPRGATGSSHARRKRFPARIPQHVTLRIRAGVGSLRRWRTLRVVRQAIASAQRADSFRIVHFNVLSNHMHFLIEADGAEALSRGMTGFAVRLARRLNAVLDRKGNLFAERYHARGLATPREVKNALRYVLLNARHHCAARGERLAPDWIDPYSSAVWFEGWRAPIRADEPWLRELVATPRPTAPARTWLLDQGWRRWGPLAFNEAIG